MGNDFMSPRLLLINHQVFLSGFAHLRGSKVYHKEALQRFRDNLQIDEKEKKIYEPGSRDICSTQQMTAHKVIG